ncbi:MAG: hypothetical protein GY930_18090 [bacterium]|nr:hypothetical protein [bacterium]
MIIILAPLIACARHIRRLIALIIIFLASPFFHIPSVFHIDPQERGKQRDRDREYHDQEDRNVAQ